MSFIIPYEPATKTVAPASSDIKADYYTDGTDDDVQIQLALDSISSSGGSVFLHAGTYYINATLNLYTNNWLRGSGLATTLWYVNAGAGSKVMIANYDHTLGNSGIIISDFQINGDYPNVAGTPNRNMIQLFESWNCTVKGLYIHDTPDSAIVLDGSYECLVTQNIIDTTVDIGVYNSGSYDNIISNNRIYHTASYGIRFVNSGSENNMANANFLYQCGVSGSVPGIIVVSSDNTAVTNNVIIEAGKAGINSTSAYTNITGNIIRKAKQQGILISGNQRNTISGNTITNCGQQTSNVYSGIALVNSTDSTITANRCGDIGSGTRQKYGIEETGTSDNNIFLGNMLDRNLTGGIIVVGANSIYSNNRE